MDYTRFCFYGWSFFDIHIYDFYDNNYKTAAEEIIFRQAWGSGSICIGIGTGWSELGVLFLILQ